MGNVRRRRAGDAVHWYYNVAALQQDFGTIRDFQVPKDFHPGSIMSLASTGRAGRGSQEGEVVGGVILKGKKQYWGRPHTHYHQGMRAGDNTLNLLCVRVLIRALNAAGRYDPAAFLHDYIAFMTAPDSHNDTYAESYHRDFFANFARGLPPERCAGAEGHDTASIGGLVALPPVIFATLGRRPGGGGCGAADPVALDPPFSKAGTLCAGAGRAAGRACSRSRLQVGPLACTLPNGWASAAKVIESPAQPTRSDLDVIGGLLSPACYIDQSLPAVLYLAARYADDFEAALIANTNVGGDNCHRGAVLGAILGAALGYAAIPERWIHGLQARAELEAEIETFIARFA